MASVQLSTQVDDYLINGYDEKMNYCQWSLTKETSLIIGFQHIKIHAQKHAYSEWWTKRKKKDRKNDENR